MHVQKVTAASAVVALAIGGLTAFGSGSALADGRGSTHHGRGATATATGGSATGSVFQQNTAQQSRQNNNCSNENSDGRMAVLTGSRLDGRCVTADGSLNHHAFVRSGDAKAKGGSGGTSLIDQNTAQLGRQNNNCNNPNEANLTLTGSTLKSHCVDQDVSRNKHTRVKGGGAKAKGGSSTVADVFEQNTAQEGRQNNNCANPNVINFTATGSRIESLCANKDASRNKRTRVKGGGAKAEGGAEGVSFVDQQNTAQEGRQNNNCANPAGAGIDPTGSRIDDRCVNKDKSKNHKTSVKGGGAKAKGGDDIGGSPDNQTTAQEGRQNNNCGTRNLLDFTANGSRTDDRCVNKDKSKNHKTSVKSGGAKASTGSGVSITEQATAQEGRQNNNCANQNGADVTVESSRLGSRCVNKDKSKNHKTSVKSGGAKAEGGDSLASVTQQSTAQEGRQNNSCANPNNSEFVLTGSRKQVDCKTVDGSANVRTKVKSGGAKAEGGSGTLGLIQQNTAQEGRQSNNCGNPNNQTLTASGSRSTTQCVAVDRSKNIGSSYR